MVLNRQEKYISLDLLDDNLFYCFSWIWWIYKKQMNMQGGDPAKYIKKLQVDKGSLYFHQLQKL